MWAWNQICHLSVSICHALNSVTEYRKKNNENNLILPIEIHVLHIFFSHEIAQVPLAPVCFQCHRRFIGSFVHSCIVVRLIRIVQLNYCIFTLSLYRILYCMPAEVWRIGALCGRWQFLTTQVQELFIGDWTNMNGF